MEAAALVELETAAQILLAPPMSRDLYLFLPLLMDVASPSKVTSHLFKKAARVIIKSNAVSWPNNIDYA